MRSASRFESLAIRFAPYIEELHMFLTSCGVDFGSPEDVPSFAERLSAPGYLRDGVSAMIRAVIYREKETVSHVELVELVLVAVGGPQIDEEAPEFEVAKRHLSRFIGQAMASLWNMPSIKPIEFGPEEHAPGSFSHEAPATHHTAFSVPEQILPSPQAELQTVLREHVIVPEHLNGAAAVRVLDHEEAAEEPEAGLPEDSWPAHSLPELSMTARSAQPIVPADPVFPVAGLEPLPSPRLVPRRTPSIPPKAPLEPTLPPGLLWAAGLCALLIAPGIDLVRHHFAAQHPPPLRIAHSKQLPVTFTLPAPLPSLDAIPEDTLTAATDTSEGGDVPTVSRASHHRATRNSARTATGAAAPGVLPTPEPAPTGAAGASAKDTDLPSPDRSAALPAYVPGGSAPSQPGRTPELF